MDATPPPPGERIREEGEKGGRMFDEERFHKRLEALEKSSQETALQLARLNSHIESEAGNQGRWIDTFAKIVERHERLLYGDNSTPGLISVREDFKEYQLQDRWVHGTLVLIFIAILGKMIFHF